MHQHHLYSQLQPDKNLQSFVGFYPVAIVNINDVDAMGVIQTGSRVVYRNLFSGTQDNLERFEKSLEDMPAGISSKDFSKRSRLS